MRNELREVEALSAFKHKGIVGYNHSWVETPPDDWQVSNVHSVLKIYKKIFSAGQTKIC